MTRRRATGLFAVAVGLLGWCAAAGVLIGGDPMLAVELTGGALVVLWAALLARDVATSHRLAKALSAHAHDVTLFGVPCRVSPEMGMEAVVVGGFRPRVFVGPLLLATLTHDELEAVVYHEDHHRRTCAPLRAAALGAWLRLLGRSATVRGVVLDRLADLEMLADADAIRRGSSPGSLARALLKGDTSARAVAFSYAAERRVGRLLERAAGNAVEASHQPPYEWLPVVLLGLATIACHAVL